MEWDATSIGKWYQDAYRTAGNNPEGKITPDPKALALKLIEEGIELALALGANPVEIDVAFCRALDKETSKMRAPDYNAGDPKMEFADCLIVMCTIQWLMPSGVLTHNEISAIVDKKMLTNTQRKWQINEFGALSHIKP